MNHSAVRADQDSGLEAEVRGDQLAVLKAGLLVSMPTSFALSVVILIVHWISGNGYFAATWFLAINAINIPRFVLALRRAAPETSARKRDQHSTSRQLRFYSFLALLSGVGWSFLAVLTNGFTTPHAAIHLIILAGISAGAAAYGGSYAAPSINFITPPLLVTAACLVMMGSLDAYLLAFAVLLFLGGLARNVLRSETAFREASFLRHEAERHAAQMERSSRTDPLTGLFNRRGLERAFNELQDHSRPLVTMLIDLDGFKSVNDTYGHSVGDDLLIQVSQKIRAERPDGAVVARIGGDEFLMIYPSAENSPASNELASRIIVSLASPFSGMASVRTGASIGICVSERSELSEVLLRADIALYTAKRRGRNEFRLFDSDLAAALQRRQCIERDLREAIEAGRLTTWFQPMMNLETGAVAGFEALLRWTHPKHGDISPPEIVTAARETGMIQMVTETVFLNCCGLIDELAKAKLGRCRVAMNVSPRELEAGNIDDLILVGLEERNLPARMFEIEITEEAPVDPDRVDEKLGRLSHAGVSIALDDFGTGFSTLAALKDRRINRVKIDRAFIKSLSSSQQDKVLVKAIIELGETLGVEVIAEGVETEETRDMLQAFGCKLAQGYLFSRAIPKGQALEMVMRESA